jgi:RecA-family ATPase
MEQNAQTFELEMTFDTPLRTKAYYQEPEDLPARADDCVPGDLRRYLQACFQADEHVAVCVEAVDGRPGKPLAFPVSHLVDQCRQPDMEAIVGETTVSGAWIGVNPVNAEGCRDRNITAYRHALLKTDEGEPGRQLASIWELELPCASILYSGNGTLHAIVRIEADSLQQYRERVDYLYRVAARVGLHCDAANRYPSRMTRLPGVRRGESWQYTVSGPCGKPTWQEWKEHADDLYDDLPDIQCAADLIERPPQRYEELIKGVLRRLNKLRVTGPSKAGKSFGLYELVVAVAEGVEWLGFEVRKGSVLLINTELDEPESWWRLREVYEAMGIDPRNAHSIDVWNLRGRCKMLDVLAPKLIRRAAQRGAAYDMVILDPIYKVAGRSENDPAEVAQVCDTMDIIAGKLNAAFVYCHHHSKGMQGQKVSMDRASGSGVWSRDADSMLDLIELLIPEKRRTVLVETLARQELRDVCALANLEFEQHDKQAATAEQLVAALCRVHVADAADITEAYASAVRRANMMTGWRLEGSFRGFPPLAPRPLWFRHPIHVSDTYDLLKDAKAAGEEVPWVQRQRDRAESKKARDERKRRDLDEAISSLGPGHRVTDYAKHIGASTKTLRRMIHRSRDWAVVKAIVCKRTEDSGDEAKTG